MTKFWDKGFVVVVAYNSTTTARDRTLQLFLKKKNF